MPGLTEMFDACFVSYRTGFMKPEREAYLHALRELDVAPHEVLFLDDLEPNVAAARGLGLRAERVRGFADVAPLLRAAGLGACDAG
jgi:putative hydrolase of the HAD superfamily